MKQIHYLLIFLFLFACQAKEKPPVTSNDKDQGTAVEKQTESTAAVSPAPNAKLQESAEDINTEFKFKRVAMEMKAINYELKNYKEVPPEKTNLNIRIKMANVSGKYELSSINMNKVKVVRRIFIKGTKPTSKGGNTYPRANVEAWDCEDENAAKEKIKAIDALKEKVPWDVISKSPITYWQDGNSVFLLTPGGMYMLDEVPKIRQFLEERM